MVLVFHVVGGLFGRKQGLWNHTLCAHRAGPGGGLPFWEGEGGARTEKQNPHGGLQMVLGAAGSFELGQFPGHSVQGVAQAGR